MKPRLSHYRDVPAYVTKDGSTIRELLHPQHHANSKQSLAEAIVEVGECTQLHRHGITEELYFIIEGEGVMTLGDEQFTVVGGDSIVIAPGTAHCITNTGTNRLRFLCCCSPAYSHDDTQLLGDVS